MSYFAYEDKEKVKLVKVKEAQGRNKGNRYYCPGDNCPALMSICEVDGVENAYFRALKSTRHSKDCFYGNSANHFQSSKYDERKFIFDEAIKALANVNTKTKEKEVIHTINQIYLMCKSNDIQSCYNNVKIWKMLLDERSLKINHKGIFGYKVVEATVKKYFYNSDTMGIFLFSPILTKKYKLIVKFESQSLFSKIQQMIFSNIKDNKIRV